MFIENPNKKETYSFRVKPELLRNIKLYAQATNTTVPEILNQMIEDKVDGLHLTDDYLTEKEVYIQDKGILGLPTLEEMYNNGKYKEFDLLDNTKTSYLVEVKKIPNNLDIWTDEDGYKSFTRGISHEGIEFVLVPDLINQVTDFENEDLLNCCLVPIYFRITKKDRVEITNISFEKAISKIRDSQKIRLLDTATSNQLAVTETIHHYIKMFKAGYREPNQQGYTNEELVKDYKFKLDSALEELSRDINTNVINHYIGVFERNKEHKFIADDTPVEFTTDNTVTKLMEENQALQDRVNELETEKNNLTNSLGDILTRLEKLEKK